MKEMNKPSQENCLPDSCEQKRVLEQYPSGKSYRIPKKVEGKP